MKNVKVKPVESLYEPEPKSRFNWWKVLGGLVIALVVCLLLIDIVSAESYICTVIGNIGIAGVAPAETTLVVSEFGLKRVLEVGLVVMIVIIVLIGLIIGFNKLKDEEDDLDEDEDEKSYY